MSVFSRYQEWRGDRLKFRAEIVWLLDEMLDSIPGRFGGKWHLNGQWGCTLHLSRYWGKEEFRK